MNELNNQIKKYKEAIKQLDREKVLMNKNIKVNTSKVRIEG